MIRFKPPADIKNDFLCQEIIEIIGKLIKECEEHNSEYHHITPEHLLNEARVLIGQKEKI